MLAALAAIAPVACAELPQQSPSAAIVRLEPLARFELEGRLQVRDGERTAAVGLVWQHGADYDEWLFSGPLGQGMARIRADASGARMRLSDGRESTAASVDELGEALLGLSAPFSALPRWVTARPAEDALIRTLDVLGRPLQVVDQGWTADYLEYMGDAPSDLPRKLELHRGDTRLRLIIDAWNP